MGVMYKKRAIAVVIFAIVFIAAVALCLHFKQPSISTIIVPHHNLVAKERSALFKDIKDRIKNRNIILLSTNHYNIGSADIQTRKSSFTTSNGTIPINNDLLAVALQNGVAEEPVTFETEHGIKTILPDIAQYAPGSLILPLIIKEDASKESISTLINALYENCSSCVVVASVDFSHYQPFLLSELHDDLTRRALQKLDASLIESKSEIGEPQVLSAAIQWAKLANTNAFVEQNHTNATEIEQNYYAEGTTHFFGWYEQGTKAQIDNEVTFTFVGDVMFDRHIRDRFHPNYYSVFSKFGNRVLWGTDGIVANLEGPITNKEALPAVADMPRFTSSPLVVNVLKNLHISHIALRNNHILDADEDGLNDTKQTLATKGIATLDDNTPTIIEGNKQRMIVFNIDNLQNDSLSEKDFAQYQNSNDNIVVYIHWGPEYQQTPSATQTQIAHTLIDAGADMIIGVGPHVIQPAEVYKNRPIVYSLGNFIFDMTDNKQTANGMVLTGKFTDTKIVLQPMLTENVQLQPVLLRSANADKALHAYFENISNYQTDNRGGIQFTISK
jgi:poly-gamma-glutamate synthesis protein (capsule biosynthesis protein)